jgi:putative membrane protein
MTLGMCLAALLAAGTARAQSDQPGQAENPHSIQNKDRPTNTTTQSVTNKQLEKAEADNPHSVLNKDREQMSMRDWTPSRILGKLHHVNQEEIEAGKMAQSNGGARAQDFGRMLVDDHTKADRELTDLAKKLNVDLSAAPMHKSPEKAQEKMKMRDTLASLRGDDFDKAFAKQMADGHEKVIALVRSWRSNCKEQDLCSFLDKTLPVLQKHLDAAHALQRPAAQGRRP